MFRSFRPSDSSDPDWYDETRSPYRVYVALVLALMIAGLVYMGWRSSKSGSRTAHEAPPVPVNADKASAPTASAPSNPQEASAPKTAEPANAATAPSRKAPEAPKESTTAAAKAEQPAAEAAPTTQNSIDNGSAELAQAQHYLGSHDSAEAAKWLWKSISKHNGQATVLLADLYLKGDGVSKNCDQARVLLDSAARKGVSGAGERLRNLPAFGCQ